MLGLFRKKPKLADPLTERTCVTVMKPSGGMVVMDILNDYGAPNPWGILIDEVTAEDEFIEGEGPAAGCYDYPLNVCNGDTLLEFWLNEVED